MNKTRKFASLLLAMVMVFSMVFNVIAEEETGSITINDAVVGQTYTVYQILDLESYNAETNAYAYKANAAWAEWLTEQTAYVSMDEQGYVTWVKGADAAAFAKAAKAYAEEKKIDPSATPVKATETMVKFEGLDLGYYLIDTTLGTICSLDTTNPNVVMEEKNEVPGIEKEVKEDSTSEWGETNDADFHQTVEYQATITVQKGAENYIMHDTMSKGLTYTGVTKVTVNDEEVAGENYTVTAPGGCGCTFEVAFNNDYIAKLEAGTKIVVAYAATVNEDAVVGLEGNPNEVKLQYGDENQPSYTPVDQTITYTWDMDVLKYANNDETKVLKDAEFVLLNSDKDYVAKFVDGKFTEWVKIEDGTDLTAYALTTDESGKIEMDGLDAGTYYLREVQAPAGYNKLKDDVEAVVTGASQDDDGKLTYTTLVEKVNNNSGAELPSTGGIGTTIFYITGAALVLIAVVLLVVRRRMKAE